MNEIAKGNLRNCVSAIAYFLLALIAGTFAYACCTGVPFNPVLMGIIEGIIGVCGLILLVLHKRDLTGFVMVMFAMLFGYYTVTGGVLRSDITPMLFVFFILMAVFLLIVKDKKSKCYLCVFLPYGIGAIGPAFFSSLVVTTILHCIFGFIALVYGIMYLIPRIKIPLARVLRSDESITFASVGPILGYFLFSIPCFAIALSQMIGLTDAGTLSVMLRMCGIYLLIVALLIFIFGRRQVVITMFALMGLACLLVPIGNLVISLIFGILLVLLGIAMLLLHKLPIIPCIMLFLTGAAFILIGLGVMQPVLLIVLAIIVALAALYQSFIMMRQNRQTPAA